MQSFDGERTWQIPKLGSTRYIKSQQELKAAMQEQLWPGNSDWVIRAHFDELKHTGKAQDYVRAFKVLDLECTKLNDFEKLYLFLRNLQPWAVNKLR